MTPEEETAWTEAAKAMFRDSDLGLLAKLIRGTSPIPPWMREYLGRMLDPSTNPNESDRLVFSRSKHLAREVKKNQDKIAIGVAVHDRIKAGEVPKCAIADIGHDFGVSESYVRECMKETETFVDVLDDDRLARTLPTEIWDYARASLAKHSPHRTGPKKKKLKSRKNNDKSLPAKS